MILVDAPFGASGGGWHAAGDLVTVSVPEEVESKLIFKRTFQDFAGFTPGQSSVDFVVDGPKIITAVYNKKVNGGILALLLLIPLAAVVIYFGNRWVWRLVNRPRPTSRRR